MATSLSLGMMSVRYRASASVAASSSSSPSQQCECSGNPAKAEFRSPSFAVKGAFTAAAAQVAPVASVEEDAEFCFGRLCAKLGLVGLAAAALCYTCPALAYRGGGPYGIEVTRGQDLSGKDFSGLKLEKQDFKTSILRQANFKGAKLLGASFFDSDLTGADLTGADLRYADFSLANVAKANLTNANLEGALVTGNTSFKGAIITGADFTDVLWREDQRIQLCRAADGINPITGNVTRETLLCE